MIAVLIFPACLHTCIRLANARDLVIAAIDEDTSIFFAKVHPVLSNNRNSALEYDEFVIELAKRSQNFRITVHDKDFQFPDSIGTFYRELIKGACRMTNVHEPCSKIDRKIDLFSSVTDSSGLGLWELQIYIEAIRSNVAAFEVRMNREGAKQLSKSGWIAGDRVQYISMETLTKGMHARTRSESSKHRVGTIVKVEGGGSWVSIEEDRLMDQETPQRVRLQSHELEPYKTALHHEDLAIPVELRTVPVFMIEAIRANPEAIHYLAPECFIESWPLSRVKRALEHTAITPLSQALQGQNRSCTRVPSNAAPMHLDELLQCCKVELDELQSVSGLAEQFGARIKCIFDAVFCTLMVMHTRVDSVTSCVLLMSRLLSCYLSLLRGRPK